MSSGSLHITGSNNALVLLASSGLGEGISFIVHDTLESFLKALENDESARGVVIGPPNPTAPNQDELNIFNEGTAFYRDHMTLVVDKPDVAYWSSKLGWNNKVHEYDGWRSLRAATKKAAIALIDPPV